MLEYFFMKKLLLLCIVLALPLNSWAVEDIPRTPAMKESLFNDISANLACLCGCGTTVKSCPHENCGFSIPVRESLISMIENNLSRKAIIDKLVADKGEVILARPAFKGFNIIAYVTPFIVILAVGFGIWLMIKRWVAARAEKVKNGATASKAKNGKISSDDDQYLKKMRSELGDFED